MKKMTKQETIHLHREKWMWCAKTGEDEEKWPGWKHNGGQYDSMYLNCFLCDYVFEMLDKDPYEPNVCEKYCPLKWPEGRCAKISEIENKQYLFDKWSFETDIEKRKEYAAQIALLDEK